jgi:SMC interacting uncharacterized protein involved in chromosome segregation
MKNNINNMSTKDMVLNSWAKLGRKRRAKKEIDAAAIVEADKIHKKIGDAAHISTAKPLKFDDYRNKAEVARDRTRKQVKKTRRKIAKDKGII